MSGTVKPGPEKATGLSLYRVREVKHFTRNAYRLRVDRGSLKFKAGQCVNVGLPGAGVNREYSTYSGENDTYLDFLIKEVDNGIVSVALKSRRPGDFVEIHGAYGEFCLKTPHDGRSYLFVGSGTGIAPFHSFVRTYPKLDYKILHGIRHAEESYDKQDYDPARYISCVSREVGGNFRGRVTDYLRRHPASKETVCYMCGNRGMINEVYELLRAQGIPSDNLFTEVFF